MAGESSCVVFPPLVARSSHPCRGCRMSDEDTRPLFVQRNHSEHHGVQSALRAQMSRSMMSETANPAGTLRNRRISSLHSLLSPDDVLNVGGPTSTVQLIVCVIPIDTLDGSDRLGEWLCRVGSGTRQRACQLARQCRSCRLGEPSLNQPVEPIGFTIFIR